MYKDSIREIAENIKAGIGEEPTSKHVKKATRKVVKIVAAAAVLASLAVGTMFSAVDDITPEIKRTSINQPPIVMDIDEFGNATLEDDDEAEDKKGSGGIVTRIKQAVMSLPVAVRLLIVTPLWLIGSAIMTVVSILGRTIVASPLGAFILSTIAGFGILLGLFVVTSKMLFPDVPISKILNKNNLSTLAVIALALAGADAVAPLFWTKYALISGLVKFCVGVLTICICLTEVKKIRNSVDFSRILL